MSNLNETFLNEIKNKRVGVFWKCNKCNNYKIETLEHSYTQCSLCHEIFCDDCIDNLCEKCGGSAHVYKWDNVNEFFDLTDFDINFNE